MARRQLRPTREDILTAASVTAPLALVVLGVKVHQCLLASAGLRGVVALSSDLLFLALWLCAGLLLLQLMRGRLRRIAVVLLQLLAGVVAIVAYAEHVFFAKTGAHLDWSLLVYAISHRRELAPVIRSEVGAAVIAGLVGVLLLGLVPVLIRRLGSSRQWPGAAGPRSAFAAAAVVSVVVALVWIEVPGVHADLRRSPVVALAGGAIGSWLAPAEDPGGGLPEWTIDPVAVRATESTRHHNVVVIVLESVRARATTPYTPQLDTTPFLMKLAESRARLVERAYAVVPHTSKALVAILCGIHPQLILRVLEAGSGGIPASCLPRILRDRGYTTAFFQPAEERYEARHQLVANMGFETFRGKESIARAGFDESSYFGFEDDAMLEPSFAWIDAQAGPFFVTYLTLTSHHMYRVPAGFARRPYSERARYDDYLNTVRYTDRFVEKVVTGLGDRGLLDDTVLVIAGDHGEGFGEHGRFEHDAVIYEEGVRVPMLLMGPGTGAPGEPIAGLRQVTDTLPTVLDALGFELAGGSLSGRSLLGPPHAEVFLSCWYPDSCMANVRDRTKTIYHYERQPVEVFDVIADPFERRDLRDQLSGGEIEEQVARMQSWRFATNARYRAQSWRSRHRLVQHDPPPVEHAVDIALGEQVRLRGYDLAQPVVPTGRSLELTLHFEALADVDEPWEVFVHLIDEGGRTIRNADQIPADGSHPVRRWKKGEYIIDPRRIFIRHGTEPGRHHVALGLWRREEKDPLKARAIPTGSGARIGDDRRVRLVSFEIVEGNRGR